MALGKEYGKALFMLCEECGTTDNALADVNTADELFKHCPEYTKLLDTPALSKAEKLALVDEAFSSLDESVRNLIKILCEKHSVHVFGEVKKSFSAHYLKKV